jgi:hypothetical protein
MTGVTTGVTMRARAWSTGHPAARSRPVTEVLMTCEHCREEIAVQMDRAILRMAVEPRADAELLFVCPACDRPDVRRIVGELLTLLLFVGVEPLRLSEPPLPEDDQPQSVSPTVSAAVPPLTVDDLIAWHQLLDEVQSVKPWEP